MSKLTCAIFILCFTPLVSFSDTWGDAIRIKKAEIDLYWYASHPFIYQKEDQMVGLEHDLLALFQEYLAKEKGVDLKYNWIESKSFSSIMDSITLRSDANALGASAFSITTKRLKKMRSTTPYLPDVTVLVSSKGTKIVTSKSEINTMLREMKAITIKGTVYEFLLMELQNKLKIDLNIEYIESSENVLESINNCSDCYGFIDLPIYLIWIRKGKELVRQNHFTKRGLGYGFIMPPSSDWGIPFDMFLNDPKYSNQINKIISMHLGSDIWGFIKELHDREELSTSILTKEKEIQSELIQYANDELSQDKIYMRLLVMGIVTLLLFLFLILRLLNLSRKNGKLLVVQKSKIESQQKNIKSKNDKLINRNSQLVAINEERNYLMGILAHDLRSPVSNIINLSEMLEDNLKGQTKNENLGLLSQINEVADSMNLMITKILNQDRIYDNKNMVLKETVFPKEIMEELSLRFIPVAKKKDIEIELILPSDLISIETDHLLLFLVFQNLLSNAIKFSSFNSKVIFAAQIDNKRAIFSVQDQGPGFSEEDQLLLFEKFQKLSAKPTGGELSTGLGLSIVKRYVSQLGGGIHLQTSEGKGSTFFVNIPL